MAEVKVVALLTKDDLGQSLSYPSALAYDPVRDELYVIDASKAKVIIYSPDLFPVFSIGPGRGVDAPTGLTLDAEGNLYICQNPTEKEPKARISVFNAAAIKIKDIYFEGFEGAETFYPKSIAIGLQGQIYVVGLDFAGVVVLDRQGKFLHFLSPKDSVSKNLPAKKAVISDVFIDEKGRIYLVSEEMGRLYVYDSQERYLFKAGQKGGSSGKLSRPRGIVADPERGVIYVVDYMRHMGQAFRYEDGRLLFEFGGRGWSPGWFNYPTDIVVDKYGRIYVADLFNHRVQVVEIVEGGMGNFPLNTTPSFITPLQKLKK
ncbi:NHL repeat-containing protein [Thermosulfuriphilus sp.]